MIKVTFRKEKNNGIKTLTKHVERKNHLVIANFVILKGCFKE